ncbi:EamA family transporter [candidate division GN15 bacterium]|nr:EamA family transporter [candidate division GN15 bacterium]
MGFFENYLGEFWALMTAITWSSAVILFKKSGETVHPLGLSLFRTVLATALFIPTVWIMGHDVFHDASSTDYSIILLSGLLGIGLADVLYLQCLNTLGASLTAIVDCLYSPSVIGLSMIYLGESLNFMQMVGVLLIISAVLTATGMRKAHKLDMRTILLGVLWGGLAMFLTAVSIVIVKPVLDQQSLVWVNLWRTMAGMVFLSAVLSLHPRRMSIARSVIAADRRVYTWAGSFLGTYVAVMMWLAGLKYTQASVAAALNQSSNIFIFVFAGLFLKEQLTPLKTVGIVLGVGGVLLVTLY